MELSHTQKGDITEYEFLVYCLKRGIPVSKPITNDLPYDFILDINGKLMKIQVKLGYNAYGKNSFMFNTRSTSKNYNECTTKDYENLIDGFITCYKECPNEFFYIPIEEAKKGSMILYYGDTPRVNQNWIKDFQFNRIYD